MLYLSRKVYIRHIVIGIEVLQLTHEKKNEIIQLPPELDRKVEDYLKTDSFGYKSKGEFVRDAIRRHVELMTEVNV